MVLDREETFNRYKNVLSAASVPKPIIESIKINRFVFVSQQPSSVPVEVSDESIEGLAWTLRRWSNRRQSKDGASECSPSRSLSFKDEVLENNNEAAHPDSHIKNESLLSPKVNENIFPCRESKVKNEPLSTIKVESDDKSVYPSVDPQSKACRCRSPQKHYDRKEKLVKSKHRKLKCMCFSSRTDSSVKHVLTKSLQNNLSQCKCSLTHNILSNVNASSKTKRKCVDCKCSSAPKGVIEADISPKSTQHKPKYKRESLRIEEPLEIESLTNIKGSIDSNTKKKISKSTMSRQKKCKCWVFKYLNQRVKAPSSVKDQTTECDSHSAYKDSNSETSFGSSSKNLKDRPFYSKDQDRNLNIKDDKSHKKIVKNTSKKQLEQKQLDKNKTEQKFKDIEDQICECKNQSLQNHSDLKRNSVKSNKILRKRTNRLPKSKNLSLRKALNLIDESSKSLTDPSSGSKYMSSHKKINESPIHSKRKLLKYSSGSPTEESNWEHSKYKSLKCDCVSSKKESNLQNDSSSLKKNKFDCECRPREESVKGESLKKLTDLEQNSKNRSLRKEMAETIGSEVGSPKKFTGVASEVQSFLSVEEPPSISKDEFKSCRQIDLEEEYLQNIEMEPPKIMREGSPKVSKCAHVQFCDAAGGTEEQVEELYFSKEVKNDATQALDTPCSPTQSEPGCSVGAQDSATSGVSTDAHAHAQEVSRDAHYYRRKLHATLQLLRSKEETVAVQAQSLSVAESRIAVLSARVSDLRDQLHQLQILRKSTDIPKSDVSITARLQEQTEQKNVLSTLQNNLSVIADLYRECFYESAKQGELIDLLRKSYLDVRLDDKCKTDQISNLQKVISSQQWSFHRCQDIAMEVDNLKLEIYNFLNNSNNDSGVWEQGVGSEVSSELHEIAHQLVALHRLLTEDCVCGLDKENNTLLETNEILQKEIRELREEIKKLDSNVAEKEKLTQRYLEQVEKECGEKEELQQQICLLKKENEALKDRNEKMKEEERELGETILQLEATVLNKEQLVRRCNMCHGMKQKEMDELRHKVIELESSLRLKEELLDRCAATCSQDQQKEIDEMQQKICALESSVLEKEESKRRLQAKIDEGEKELSSVHSQLRALQRDARERDGTCSSVRLQLVHTEEVLKEKSDELERVERECRERDGAIQRLQEELSKADRLIKENSLVRGEVSYLTGQVAQWRAQLEQSRARTGTLDAQLRRARAHAAAADHAYRELEKREQEVEQQLQEASARGGELCAESRRVVRAVRGWMRRMHAHHREQQEKLERKEALIVSLQYRLKELPSSKSGSEERSDHRLSASEMASCRECLQGAGGGRVDGERISGSEMASCSSAPVPPKRLLRKKSIDSIKCAWTSGGEGSERTSGGAGCRCGRDQRHLHLATLSREMSPIEDIMERVECLSEALLEGQRRWTRPAQATTQT